MNTYKNLNDKIGYIESSIHSDEISRLLSKNDTDHYSAELITQTDEHIHRLTGQRYGCGIPQIQADLALEAIGNMTYAELYYTIETHLKTELAA